MSSDLGSFLHATLRGGPAVAVTTAPVTVNLDLDLEHGLVVRRLDGDAMRTLDGMYDQYAQAWQFPDHFWHGMDSFDDVIGDLDGGALRTATGARPAGFLTIVTHGENFLVDAAPDDFAWFAGSQAEYRDDYRTPNAYNADRPQPLEFGLLLHTEAAHVDRLVTRWAAAGAPPTLLEGA
ncbi:MAG: barstar family protein [Gordonia sp. (in: high G+C Gram-positive bacteria)]|uniref:barstar family protein n=1 Tax=Gordonia sp. (in: high G+C Gram-positive bacteria) TaxID=84139 RepID=UPI0039E4D15A